MNRPPEGGLFIGGGGGYGLGSLPSDPRPSGALRASKMLAHFVNPLRGSASRAVHTKEKGRLTAAFSYWWRWRVWTRIAPKRSSPFGRTSCVQNAGAFCEPATRLRFPRCPRKRKRPPNGSLFLLVEAAGIEPASASPPLRALHAYSVFNLITGYPTGRENL